MDASFVFIVNSMLLGVGLAMDAFSVSLANGLSEPKMSRGRMCAIAGVFAFFQAAMPMIGWLCVHTVLEHFRMMTKFVPWIALALLAYIGGSMLIEGIRNKDCAEEGCAVGAVQLLMQGVATSIDALSVGVDAHAVAVNGVFFVGTVLEVRGFKELRGRAARNEGAQRVFGEEEDELRGGP